MFTSEIKNSLLKALKAIGMDTLEAEISLEHPADFKNGDYSSNIALVLSKKLNKNPKELAKQIIAKWQERGLPDFVEKVEVAGPGFINIWLSFDAYSRQLMAVLEEGVDYGRGLPSTALGTRKCAKTEKLIVLADFSLHQKTMVIDYSAPNIAKPFGIGHLRSTNIGQAIYNLYKYLGWKVIGDNHLGDWGTQFGKLIFQIEFKVKSLKLKVEDLTIEDLEKLYIEFHKEAETHPEMEEKAREWFKKLEEGDEEAKEIWQACVDISLKEFNRVYELLGVKIDYAYGESFYQDKMAAVLSDCKEKGLLKESQGAQVVELQGMEIPAMLVKSDGATTYLLRDLAAVKFRKEKWSPDLFVYEVGADQTFHFQQLFKLCVLLDYGKLNQFVHIAHGLIRWPTGKFSTRKGDTIHLEEVLKEAIERAKKIKRTVGKKKDCHPEFISGSISEKILKQVQNDSELADDKIAQAVGIGAIKYNDLKQNPRTDIIFDWEQILTLQGNSGPYLQYTFARAQSVLGKSKENKKSSSSRAGPALSVVEGSRDLFPSSKKGIPPCVPPMAGLSRNDISGEETTLLRTIYRFPEMVEEAAREFSPNLLCNFLFDLAQKFNLFYDKHRILSEKRKAESAPKEFLRNSTGQAKPKLKTGNEDEVTEEQSNFRLLLTTAVGQVLKNGLTILGIEPLEKM